MKTCPKCHSTFPADFTVCPRDSTPLIAAGVWTEGTVLRDKYRILEKIGSGGMAVVYKVEHVHFREVRAIKVIIPQYASDEDFIRRFMQEAISTRRLQDPHAVRVDDIDRADRRNSRSVMTTVY